METDYKVQRSMLRVNRRVPRSYISPFIKNAETLARTRATAATNYLRLIGKSKKAAKEWDSNVTNNVLFDPSIKREEIIKQERKLRIVESISLNIDKISNTNSKFGYNSTVTKNRQVATLPKAMHTLSATLSVDYIDDDSVSIENTFFNENHIIEMSKVSRPTSPIDETYIKYLLGRSISGEMEFVPLLPEIRSENGESSSSGELCGMHDEEYVKNDDFGPMTIPLVDIIGDYKSEILYNQTSDKLESCNSINNAILDQLNIVHLLEKFTSAIDKMQELFVSSKSGQMKDSNETQFNSKPMDEAVSKAIENCQYSFTDVQETKPSSKGIVMDILIETAQIDKRRGAKQLKSEERNKKSVKFGNIKLDSTEGPTFNSTDYLVADKIVTSLPTSNVIPNDNNRNMGLDLGFKTSLLQPNIGYNKISIFEAPFTTPAALKTHETSIIASINSSHTEYLTTLLNKTYSKPVNKMSEREKIRLLSISLLPKVCISHEAAVDFKSYKARYCNSRRLRDVSFNSNGTTLRLIVDMITDKIQCGIVHDIICEIESILNDYTKIFLNKI